jgi:hypothetical protein
MIASKVQAGVKSVARDEPRISFVLVSVAACDPEQREGRAKNNVYHVSQITKTMTTPREKKEKKKKKKKKETKKKKRTDS